MRRLTGRPLLAENVPDGTFGGARRLAADGPLPPRPDPDAALHLADLAADVAAIDKSRNYGVNRRYQTAAHPAVTAPKGTP